MIDEDYYIEFLVNLSDAEKESIRKYLLEWLYATPIDVLVCEYEKSISNRHINHEEKIEQFQLHDYDEVSFIYSMHNYSEIAEKGISTQQYTAKRCRLHIKGYMQGRDKKKGTRENISELNYVFQISFENIKVLRLLQRPSVQKYISNIVNKR